MANHSEDFDEVTEWMEKYPNLLVELGGRIAELGRQPRRASRFLRQFQDRVMFGMDTKLTAECYRTYFRFLETEDECFEYPGYPWLGAWKIYGLGLSDDVSTEALPRQRCSGTRFGDARVGSDRPLQTTLQ